MSELRGNRAEMERQQVENLPGQSQKENRYARAEMSGLMKRMTTVLVITFILMGSSTADAQNLSGGEIKISSDGNGSVAGVSIDERSLPVGAEPGGIFIRDLTNANIPAHTLFEEGFEDVDHDWVYHYNTGSSEIDWVTVDSSSYEGVRCLLVQMHDGASGMQKGRLLSSADKMIPVTSGTRYRVQCTYKALRGYLSANPGYVKTQCDMYDPAEGFYMNGIGVSWLDANGYPVGGHCFAAPFMDQAMEWKPVGGTLVCPEGAVYARVSLGANFDPEYPQEGYLVDGIRFFEDPSMLQQVQGSFSSGGWDKAVFDGVVGPYDVHLSSNAVEEGIFFTGTVEALDGNSHAFDLVVSIPVDGEGWTWWDDAETSREISGSLPGWYANEVSADSQSNLPISLYPYGGMHDSQSGLAGCLPLDPIHMASIGYNAERKAFEIVYRLALAPALGHSMAVFSGGFYAFDPADGFRGIIEKYRLYWKDNEEWFSSSFDPREYREFYRGSFRGQSGAQKGWAMDDNKTYSCLYLCPDFIVDEVAKAGTEDPPTMTEILALIGERLNSADPIENYYYNNVFSETMQSGNSDLILKHCESSKSSNGWIRAEFKITPSVQRDADGYIGFIRDNFLTAGFECTMYPHPSWGAGPSFLEGVMLDNFCNQVSLDFDPDHIASATWGLTYSANDYRVGLSPVLGAQDIVKWLRNWLDSNIEGERRSIVPNWMGIGNSNGIIPWSEFLLDEVCSAVENGQYGFGRNSSFDPAIMRYKRALAYGKYRGQKFNGKRLDEEDVLDTFHTYLLYATAAMLDEAMSFKNPSSFGFEQCKAFADSHNTFIALLHTAGWEPCTRASCSTPGIFMERYGSPEDGTFYLVVFNDSGSYTSGTVRLSEALGLAEQPLEIYEEVAGMSYPIGGSSPSWTIDFNSLRNRRSLVFRITVDSSGFTGPGYPRLMSNGNGLIVSTDNQGASGDTGARNREGGATTGQGSSGASQNNKFNGQDNNGSAQGSSGVSQNNKFNGQDNNGTGQEAPEATRKSKRSSGAGSGGDGGGTPAQAAPQVTKKTKAQERAEARAAAQAAAKAKAEARKAALAEARAIAKAKREAKAQARAEAVAIAKVEREAKAQARAEAMAIAKAEREAKAQAKREARAKVRAEAKAKAEARKAARALKLWGNK